MTQIGPFEGFHPFRPGEQARQALVDLIEALEYDSRDTPAITADLLEYLARDSIATAAGIEPGVITDVHIVAVAPKIVGPPANGHAEAEAQSDAPAVPAADLPIPLMHIDFQPTPAPDGGLGLGVRMRAVPCLACGAATVWACPDCGAPACAADWSAHIAIWHGRLPRPYHLALIPRIPLALVALLLLRDMQASMEAEDLTDPLSAAFAAFQADSEAPPAPIYDWLMGRIAPAATQEWIDSGWLMTEIDGREAWVGPDTGVIIRSPITALMIAFAWEQARRAAQGDSHGVGE